MRADQLLLQRGLASTRSQAQRLIAAGVQWRMGAGSWQAVRKNGDELPAFAELHVQDDAESRYVSRGGLKLQGALQAVGLDVRGWRCLDVGQSTGGFTDCLLQHGAAFVTGLDVGTGQLHPRLQSDKRVQGHEHVNARDAAALRVVLGNPPAVPASGKSNTQEAVAQTFDLLVADVSFISLTLVLPAVVPYLKPGARLLVLVKPQFELQPAQLAKGGIVKDTALYATVEQRLRQCCMALGLQVLHWLPSPIAGGDGNREFFIHATMPAVGSGNGNGKNQAA